MNTNPYLNSNPNEGSDQKGANHGGEYPRLSQPEQHNLSNQNLAYGQPVYQGQPAYQGQQPYYPNNQTYPPQYQVQPQNQLISISVGGRQNVNYANCPICKKATQTIMRYQSGGLVWIMALVFCFFTGCLCFIPFFIDQWKNKQFVCATCQCVKGVEEGRLCWSLLFIHFLTFNR